MAVGASFGRFVGLLVRALHSAYPTSGFFSGCPTDGGVCITPGTYAFLGAAAALSGIMHITVCVVVIMFELTGGVRYILPTMIVVGVTKMVGSYFGKGGIADRYHPSLSFSVTLSPLRFHILPECVRPLTYVDCSCFLLYLVVHC